MKKNTPFIVTALTSLLLAASCSLAGNNQEQNYMIETLYGIQLHKDKLTVRVKSNGCTKAEHFGVQAKAELDHHLLTVVRTKADRCRKMPRIISIELDSPTTVKNGYRLVNPLQSG